MTHNLHIIALGAHPAAFCSCQKWGFAFAGAANETDATKRAKLAQEHAQHAKAFRRRRK